jgi:hypothetical protein
LGGWVADMKSWDRPKSYILVRELGRLGRYDSIGALPEESLLETRERGFGLGTGGIIDDLEVNRTARVQLVLVQRLFAC